MRAHSSLRLGTLHGTTPELLASPWYCAWGFCMVWEAGLPHKTSSAPPQRRNGRACSSLTARGGGLPVGVMRAPGRHGPGVCALRSALSDSDRSGQNRQTAASAPAVPPRGGGLEETLSPHVGQSPHVSR